MGHGLGGQNSSSFTREKLVHIGVHSIGSQAQEFFLPEISAPPPYLGQAREYEQNGVGEKRGRVRLNRLSGRKMGERYVARKAEIGGAFQKERESAGVETRRSRISRGFGKQRKDRGTSGRILGCSTVRASRNSIIFIQQSRLVTVLPSPPSHALPFLIALACLCAVVSLLVSAALLQGAFSQPETHMHGERVRHKIASREGRASSVVAPRPLSGSLYLREIGTFLPVCRRFFFVTLCRIF